LLVSIWDCWLEISNASQHLKLLAVISKCWLAFWIADQQSQMLAGNLKFRPNIGNDG
jgi:hypothetical protein